MGVVALRHRREQANRLVWERVLPPTYPYRIFRERRFLVMSPKGSSLPRECLPTGNALIRHGLRRSHTRFSSVELAYNAFFVAAVAPLMPRVRGPSSLRFPPIRVSQVEFCFAAM